MSYERIFTHERNKNYLRIPRTDLIGKVVRLKSHQKWGVITAVSYSKAKGTWQAEREDTCTVKWLVGYTKPKTTEVGLYSVYDCSDMLEQLEKQTSDYKECIAKVNGYYDKP